MIYTSSAAVYSTEFYDLHVESCALQHRVLRFTHWVLWFTASSYIHVACTLRAVDYTLTSVTSGSFPIVLYCMDLWKETIKGLTLERTRSRLTTSRTTTCGQNENTVTSKTTACVQNENTVNPQCTMRIWITALQLTEPLKKRHSVCCQAIQLDPPE